MPAVVAATEPAPSPKPYSAWPGSTAPTNPPSAVMPQRTAAPAAMKASPPLITGPVPRAAINRGAAVAPAMTPSTTGRQPSPVAVGDHPSTDWRCSVTKKNGGVVAAVRTSDVPTPTASGRTPSVPGGRRGSAARCSQRTKPAAATAAAASTASVTGSPGPAPSTRVSA